MTSDGLHHAAVSAPESLLAPIPVAGPEARFYLTNSPRVFVEANVSTACTFLATGASFPLLGALGFTINRHLTLNAGYQLGSRLVVNKAVAPIELGLT